MFQIVFLSIYFVIAAAQSGDIWCLKSVVPKSFVPGAAIKKDITYNQVHCTQLCDKDPSCEAFTYYYDYTCSTYAMKDISEYVYAYNNESWASCIAKDIINNAVIFGKTTTVNLNLTSELLCVKEYNTLGINIQSVPPEPPYSPPDLSTCVDTCSKNPDCQHVIFQPKYKELPVSACWLKNSFGSGVNGVTGIDALTQATCFKSIDEYINLGRAESTEFKIIPETLSNKNKNRKLLLAVLSLN